MNAFSRKVLIAWAREKHDETCRCDPKYVMSCPRMANAILEAGTELRRADASLAPALAAYNREAGDSIAARQEKR